MANRDPRNDERRKRQRSRNLALLAVLIGIIVLFYVMTVVQFGGDASS